MRDISVEKAFTKGLTTFTDQSSERKRRYSNNNPLSATQINANLNHYGEIILHCPVCITRNIKDQGNVAVLRYICALLNCGGGILHMVNTDLKRTEVLSKHLDTWWSGMEIRLTEILSRDDICNYFDLVGNHDDQDLYVFVKSAEHLCTIQYHCRLPTDTATHDVKYQSMLRLLVKTGEPGLLEDLPTVPQRFVYGQSDMELKKETKQIQFKQLKYSKSPLPERITGLMKKYVSAFANHEGGHIYFGIDDVRASVIGEELSPSEQKRTEFMVEGHLKKMIWGSLGVNPVRRRHWDIQFYNVKELYRKPRRVVVVISIVKFAGGVFTYRPYSSYVNQDGQVSEFTFTEWKDAMLNPLRDIPELHHRFIKLPMAVPRAPLIFTLPDSIENVQEKVLLANRSQVQPRHYIESFARVQQREPVAMIIKQLLSPNSLCFGMQCWGLNIPLKDTEDIICDIVTLTEEDGLCVITLSISNRPHVYKHSQTAAAALKTKLVLQGGCTDKIAVICSVVNVTDGVINNTISPDIYPSHFKINKQKFNNILKSLVITMGSYKAKSQFRTIQSKDKGYYFMLTRDQFELLWSQQFTRELWVHGPSGAGKTVTVIQMIEELQRRGCSSENILYLAENEKLCNYIRSFNICMVTNRRSLLSEVENFAFIPKKYSKVCNVFIDEAQNFKARDGDWYSLAEKLANQKAEKHLFRCSNYFWLFMDYSQKVHKFEAGLPGVIGKNNFMLSEISRSTREIFDFTSRLMTETEHVDEHFNPYPAVYKTPRLAHSYSSGKGVDILSCKDTEMKSLLSQVMSGLLQNGIQERDIAILVGKSRELDKVQNTLQDIHLDDNAASGRKKDIVDICTARSVDEHLKECGSDDNIRGRGWLSSDSTLSDETCFSDNIDDESEDESIEISNPFEPLSKIKSSDSSLAGSDIDNEIKTDPQVTMETNLSDEPVSFYGNVTDNVDEESFTAKRFKPEKSENEDKKIVQDNGVTVDTVRRFDGLDKAAVIGINPYVNEEHADFRKFLVNLASRAKDNLIIITTSDSIREQLQQYTK